MRLLNSIFVTVFAFSGFISSWASATTSPLETLVLINCVDGRNTENPFEYVNETFADWEKAPEFDGFEVNDATPAEMHAVSFFKTGKFAKARVGLIKNSVVTQIIWSPTETMACMVKSGEGELNGPLPAITVNPSQIFNN